MLPLKPKFLKSFQITCLKPVAFEGTGTHSFHGIHGIQFLVDQGPSHCCQYPQADALCVQKVFSTLRAKTSHLQLIHGKNDATWNQKKNQRHEWQIPVPSTAWHFLRWGGGWTAAMKWGVRMPWFRRYWTVDMVDHGRSIHEKSHVVYVTDTSSHLTAYDQVWSYTASKMTLKATRCNNSCLTWMDTSVISPAYSTLHSSAMRPKGTTCDAVGS